MTSPLTLPGGDPSGSTLPLLFSELLDGPERRDEFLQTLADTAEREGITGLAVGVVISFSGLVLLLRRRDDDSADGRWELPTGTVEPGETLVEAVTRVVRNQTGLNVVTVRSYIGSLDYEADSRQRVRQYNFVAEVVPTAQITLTSHQEHAWARPDTDQPVSATDQSILATFADGLKR